MDINVLETENVNKRFINVIALRDINFDLRKGEIHGLVGENGAGKSTLIKILSGAIKPDSGNIKYFRKNIKNMDTCLAKKIGIVTVHQNISLVPHLSVAENICFANFPRKQLLFFCNILVNWEEVYKKSNQILGEIGFNEIDTKKKLSELPTEGMKKAVQIASALLDIGEIKILILDEPTAILNAAETIKLFNVLNKLKKKGISIIYISHYLDEILEIADRITVLRDAKKITTVEKKKVTKDDLVSLMIGREINSLYSHKKEIINEEVLSVKDLNGYGFSDVNFKLHKGEVLGIVGLSGSGRTGITRTIFGILPIKGGSISVNKKEVNIKNPKDAMQLGIGLLPEDRQIQGLVTNLRLRENITLTNLKKVSNFLGLLNFKKECEAAQGIVEQLKIKTPNVDEKTSNLSGGNQQKVNFAKWIFFNSDILILEEPTNGIDIGAKIEIYKLIEKLAKKGKSIILVSSEVPEVLGLSDYILVVSKGKVTANFSRVEATEKKIMKAMV